MAASPMSSMLSPLMSMATKGAQAGIQAGTGAASAASQAAATSHDRSRGSSRRSRRRGLAPSRVRGRRRRRRWWRRRRGGTLASRSIAASPMVQPETASPQPSRRPCALRARGTGGAGMMGAHRTRPWPGSGSELVVEQPHGGSVPAHHRSRRRDRRGSRHCGAPGARGSRSQ